MTPSGNGDAPHDIPGLDERFYSLSSEELAFFLMETRIDSKSALKSHLMDVQARAYKVSLAFRYFSLRWYTLSSGLSISLHTAFRFYEVGGT
jgi:hypothetical protein